MTVSSDPPGDDLLFEQPEPGIAIVRFNRPHVRNAIDAAMTRRLEQLADRVERDPTIRVAILASSNPQAFCAGGDLRALAQGDGAQLMTERGGFAGFADLPRSKPWIAAVCGAAVGGGFELALACDMIVASDDAWFGLPEVKRGLIAGGGGAWRLPRWLPRPIALELIATGDPIMAVRALAYGMINRVVPLAEVEGTALGLARAIASNSILAVAESLALARQAQGLSDAELQALSAAAGARILASEDAREGTRAFLEKRLPIWKDR
jgi:enoyl-CoA hydratase/carnithine racemase